MFMVPFVLRVRRKERAPFLACGSENQTLDPASFGVLLLAHGGPSTPEDIPSFLELMRGRAPSAERVQKVTERYRLIGGSSPAPEFAASVVDLEIAENDVLEICRRYYFMLDWIVVQCEKQFS